MNNPTIINAILFALGIGAFGIVYYLEKRGWINWFRGLVVVVCIAYTITLSSNLIGSTNVQILVVAFFWAMLPVIILDLVYQVSKLDEWGRVFERLAREDREQIKKERTDDSANYRRHRL